MGDKPWLTCEWWFDGPHHERTAEARPSFLRRQESKQTKPIRNVPIHEQKASLSQCAEAVRGLNLYQVGLARGDCAF